MRTILLEAALLGASVAFALPGDSEFLNHGSHLNDKRTYSCKVYGKWGKCSYGPLFSLQYKEIGTNQWKEYGKGILDFILPGTDNGWGLWMNPQAMLREDCVASCKALGARYAAFGGGTQCACGSLIYGVKIADSSCPNKCTGSAMGPCGGPDGTWTIYKDMTYCDPTDDDSEADYKALGCYWDDCARVVKMKMETSDNMSVSRCKTRAQAAGYPYFAVEGGKDCYAGGALRPGARKATDKDCWTSCSGNPGEKCGGSWAAQVYYNKNLAPPQPCGPNPQPPKSRPATPKVTITQTTPGPQSGTTTKTGSKTDTVVITTPKVTITQTTPGPQSGVTTKIGSKTDTVVITTPKVTITETTPGPQSGTTTRTGSRTDTVVITTPKVTITQTTPGPQTGITTKIGSKTDTVIITTPVTSKVTITQTTPGPQSGTTTKTGSKTDTIIITIPNTPIPTPTPNPPTESCCIMPKPSGDVPNGVVYPLGGFKASTVYWSPNDAKFVLVKLSGIDSNCPTTYGNTITDFQNACWNACTEQQKKCYATYASKELCGSGSNATCYNVQQLKEQCDCQFKACKKANTDTKITDNPLKDAMSKCTGDNGYYR
ncbi:hypothetical protein TWF694_008429 [Orbilia ellipsospora]|uniref:WSC domain-containing protein n=1 Tax=Orbilia ellipsospora TaxID=2528407 RepID=A0AAV9XGH6_9PEZI